MIFGIYSLPNKSRIPIERKRNGNGGLTQSRGAAEENRGKDRGSREFAGKIEIV
jgi:hypothetical protein